MRNTTMTQANSLQVFRPPATYSPAHIASDVPHWIKLYNYLCDSNKQHRRSMKELYKENETYCKPFAWSKKKVTTTKTMEQLQQDLRDLQERKKEELIRYQEAQKALKDLSHALNENSHIGEPAEHLIKLYNHARHSLDKQTAAVDKSKFEYHKAMFKIEKVSIKSKLATLPGVVYKAEKRKRHLTEKSEPLAEKYQNELVEWRKHAEHLSKVASDLEAKFIETEAARANLVIGNLAACCNNDKTGFKSSNDNRAPLFRGINGREVVLERVKKMTETIIIPMFETYIPGETEATYATATSSLLADNDSDNEDDTESDLENLEETRFKNEIQANRKLKKLRKSQVLIVTEAYEKQNLSELSLKVGERVKQLLPANGDGYSYGEVIHGKMRKKKKGYYPDSHVSLIELLDSDYDDDDDDDDYNVKKQKKKVIKKVVARAKSISPTVDENKPVHIEDANAIADSNYVAYDLSDDEYDDDGIEAKPHKKSKLKKLVKMVKPKKSSNTSNILDEDINLEVEEDLAHEDLLKLYKRKDKVQKVIDSINKRVGEPKKKNEDANDVEDVTDMTDVKPKKNRLKSAVKLLKGGKKDKPKPQVEAEITTMVHSFNEVETGCQYAGIDDAAVEMPKKKSKGFSKLKKMFKRHKKEVSVAVEGEDAIGKVDNDQIDFAFARRAPKITEGRYDGGRYTEVQEITDDDLDF